MFNGGYKHLHGSPRHAWATLVKFAILCKT